MGLAHSDSSVFFSWNLEILLLRERKEGKGEKKWEKERGYGKKKETRKQKGDEGEKKGKKGRVRAGKYSLNLLPREKSPPYNQCQKIHAFIHKKLQFLVPQTPYPVSYTHLTLPTNREV